MNLPRRHVVCRIALASLLSAVLLVSAQAQQPPPKLDSLNAARVKQMLHDAYNEVKKNYYDKEYHGQDWDAKYHEFDEKLKQISTLGQGFSVVAALMMTLDDSHTFFIPPERPVRIEYGFRLLMVGDRAFITRVRPGTEAQSKLHPGDEVIAYNRYALSREGLWKMNYYFNRLAPIGGSDLVVKNPDGQEREEKVAAKTLQLKRVVDLTRGSNDIWQLIRDEENLDHNDRQRYYEMGDVLIWKMPQFDLDDNDVDRMFGIARKHKTLVLDLRENPGGAILTLERMLGNVFDRDVKIAARVGRKELKPQLAKTRGKDTFNGKIIVLIDSGSASAAELFARVMQLEKRGTVLGDRSSGAVMESRHYSEAQGADTKVFYSFSITDANLIMADGKSLEHTGVTPDEIVLPTGKDLADAKDPALSRAAQLAGLTLDPAAAGKLFPFEWVPMTQ